VRKAARFSRRIIVNKSATLRLVVPPNEMAAGDSSGPEMQKAERGRLFLFEKRVERMTRVQSSASDGQSDVFVMTSLPSFLRAFDHTAPRKPMSERELHFPLRIACAVCALALSRTRIINISAELLRIRHAASRLDLRSCRRGLHPRHRGRRSRPHVTHFPRAQGTSPSAVSCSVFVTIGRPCHRTGFLQPVRPRTSLFLFLCDLRSCARCAGAPDRGADHG